MGIGFRKDSKLVRALNVSSRHHRPTPTESLADYLFRSISRLFANSELCPAAWRYPQYQITIIIRIT